MYQHVKENRAKNCSPIYKEFSQDLNTSFEIDNLFSQIVASRKIQTIHCNSFFAEQTINAIIDYFNEKSRLDTNFKNSILNEINDIQFAYPNDHKKLETTIEVNAENSFITSANGMRNILDAFISYSDFESNSNSNYFEDIDYIIEPSMEVHDSSKIWLIQTIDEPWYN